MRIAIALQAYNPGGAETISLRLAEGLARAGHHIDLLALVTKGSLLATVPNHSNIRIASLNTAWRKKQHRRERQIPADMEILHFGPSWSTHWLSRFRIASHLPEHIRGLRTSEQARRAHAALCIAHYINHARPDILLAAQTHSQSAPLFVANRLARQRPLIIYREPISFSTCQPTVKRALLYAYQHADHIIAVSHSLAENLINHAGVPEGKITAIQNPTITTKVLNMAMENPAHPWLNNPQISVVLAAGRLVPDKNFHILLQAFAYLHRKEPATRLIILGEGPERRSLEAATRRLGIAEKIFMPGWLPNPYAMMANANLFTISSKAEGFPNVLAEALACGCPVVSTDCLTGPREILDNGRYGRLVPVGDPEALANAMQAALQEQPDRDALRQRGQFFSLERGVEQYIHLFSGILQRAQSAETTS